MLFRSQPELDALERFTDARLAAKDAEDGDQIASAKAAVNAMSTSLERHSAVRGQQQLPIVVKQVRIDHRNGDIPGKS